MQPSSDASLEKGGKCESASQDPVLERGAGPPHQPGAGLPYQPAREEKRNASESAAREKGGKSESLSDRLEKNAQSPLGCQLLRSRDPASEECGSPYQPSGQTEGSKSESASFSDPTSQGGSGSRCQSSGRGRGGSGSGRKGGSGAESQAHNLGGDEGQAHNREGAESQASGRKPLPRPANFTSTRRFFFLFLCYSQA